jgi:hypothetical protein
MAKTDFAQPRRRVAPFYDTGWDKLFLPIGSSA